MKQLKFKKINAFAKGKATGNPAGVIYLKPKQHLSEDEMQLIAADCKGFVNEIAFVTPKLNNASAFCLRYFSSEKEVALCGHATIAAIYDLVSEKYYPAKTDKKEFQISTQKGLLKIKNQHAQKDAIFMSAPLPKFSKHIITPYNVAVALGIKPQNISKNNPIEIVNAGLDTLIVGVTSLEICLGTMPDFEIIKNFCEINSIDIITIFCRETSSFGQFRTRVFAPTFGYLEDPATGSGNAALGYYLLKHSLWNGSDLAIEQGSSLQHPNKIQLQTETISDVQRVLFGGNGKIKMEGEYYLHS